MILVIGSEKGGTGKTTIAANLAAMVVLTGKTVALLDTDKQETASMWAAQRSANGYKRVTHYQAKGPDVPDQVRDLAQNYDEVIIDAGGRDSPELRYACGVAHRVYVPVQPFQFDIWTVLRMDELVGLAKGVNPGLQGFVLLNRISPNPVNREDEETRDFLEAQRLKHLPMADACLYDRIAVRKASRAGLSVVEFGQDPKASLEMEILFKEVYDVKFKKSRAA